MSMPISLSTAWTVVDVFDAQQHRLAGIGGVLLDDAVEVGIGVGECGHHHRGQP